ncbi:MAG TPA: PEGA domain-containing protein [Thermoanaerobaculia bacterium]|nr:PEGA domain-containing protein [Thermoanaerobaculia bacterium]
MHKRNAVAAAVLLLALTMPVVAEEASGKSRTPVVIDSRPEHAEIRLNGKFIGTTPLSYRLPDGVHRIELIRPEFQPWVRDLSVTDTPTKVVAVLQRTGRVVSAPADCERSGLPTAD